MSRLQSYLLAVITLCLSATNAETGPNLTLTTKVSTTSGEVFGPATPPPGGTAAADPTSVPTTTEVVGMSSPEASTLTETETTGAFNQTEPAPAAQPVVPAVPAVPAEGKPFQLPMNHNILIIVLLH